MNLESAVRAVATCHAWIAAGCIALTGCIAFPYGGSTPVPDLAPRLPADLPASSESALLLAQYSRGGDRSAKDVIEASFLTGDQLKTLNQRLTLRSSWRLGIASLGVGSDLPLSAEHLERACIVASDGRVVTLAFAPGSAVASGKDQVQILDPNRRRMIESALRGSAEFPLQTVDGPCGVTGETTWNKDLRSSIAAFIAGLPSAHPADDSTPLGRIFAAGWKSTSGQGSGPQGVMLLAGTSWRYEDSAEPPVFLADSDFAAVSDTVRASNGESIIRLLPSYASGAHALENISLERFCVVSLDGHGLRWVPETRSWESFDVTAAWVPEELAMMRENHPGPACMPSGTRAWSASERTRVTAFLEALHPQERPETVRSEARLGNLVLGPDHASRAQFLLVLINRTAPGDPRVVPLLFASDDFAELIETVRSVPPSEFAGGVAPTQTGSSARPDDFRPDLLCLVSVTGNVSELEPDYGPDWKSRDRWWDPPTVTQRAGSAGSWRDDAIKVVLADDPDAWQAEVCFLGSHKDWPPELRAAVVEFLRRMPGKLAAGNHS
jgi:hypothetical protein